MSARLSWFILALWAAVVLAAAPFAADVSHGLISGGFENPRDPAAWANAQLEKLPPGGRSAHSLLIEGADVAQVRAAWAAVRPAGAGVDQAGAGVFITALPNGSGVVFDARAGVDAPAVDALGARLAAQPGVQVRSVDAAAVSDEITQEAKRTLTRSTLLAAPFLILFLLLVFGAAVAAMLPMIIGVCGTILALAIVDLVEAHMTLSVYLTDIVTFFALGVGIDYSLFLSERFRRALARGLDARAALAEAMRTAGRSVFYSGLAVGLSVLALLIPQTPYWNGLALGGAVAVLAVLTATLTLLPALLALLGPRVNGGRLPQSRRLARFWPVVSARLTRSPWPFLVGGTLALAIPVFFAFDARIETQADLAAILPADQPVRQAILQQAGDFGPGAGSPLLVVVRAPGGLDKAASWQTIADLSDELAGLAPVQNVQSPTGAGVQPTLLALAFAQPGGPPPALKQATVGDDTAVLSVISRYGPDAPETRSLLQQVQARLATLPAGWQAGVGGAVATVQAFNALVGRTLPAMIALVSAVAFVVLFAASGSILIAFLAVLFDALTALATAGLMVLVVQDGLFGFEAQPLPSSIVPLVFVILFGLSMDYEVILIHRLREHARAGAPPAAAARQALAETGAMITGAGLIMVVVFAVLLASRLQVMRTLAFGMSAAILIDTWIVRTCLVPTSTLLLRRAAWWPGSRTWGAGRREEV